MDIGNRHPVSVTQARGLLTFGMPNNWLAEQMFRNILVSIDGSPTAELALEQAIELAQSNQARLTMLLAVPRAPGWVCSSPLTIGAYDTMSRELETESIEIMKAAVSRVPDCVPVTKIIVHKPIRTALMRLIREGNYDLVVMGSRGRAPIKSSMLRSVSQYVLRHSPIPVLIVRPEPEAAAPAPSPAQPDEAGSRPEAASGARPATT